MKYITSNNSGLSIIATVLVLLALSLFAAVAVSLVTTGTGTGIQEERGTESFYIADGGMQYTLKKNTYPYYAVSSTSLGNGTFTVTVPYINSFSDVGISDTSISVSSTEGFTTSNNPSDATPNQYWTLLCDTASSAIRMSSDCEKISFTTINPTSFSGGTRGRDSTDAATHPTNAVVMMYSWDTAKSTTIAARTFGKNDKCTGASSTICVADTAGFATSGFVRINNGTENNIEDVFYDGIGSGTSQCGTGCNACLGTTSCTRRAYDGNSKGTVNHVHTTTTIYQSEFSVLVTSTGRTPGAIILTDIKRVLQTNILPLKDP